MQLLNNYLKAKKELFEHLGVDDCWFYLPVEPSTEYMFNIVGGSHVDFTDEDLDIEDWDQFQDEIHGNVYRTCSYTAVICYQNRHDMYLRVFDAEKEVFTN